MRKTDIKKIFDANRMYFFVLVSFVPLALWSYVIYGFRALALELISIAACLFLHAGAWIIKKSFLKRKSPLFDLSPVVSALLLVFTLPCSVGVGVLILGCVVTVSAKELTGGLGKNIINPALAGRVFLQLVFPKSTALSLSFETTSEMSGLEAVLHGAIPERDISDMILGRADGNIGEISVILLILAGVFLIVNRVINWRTPAAFLVGATVLSVLLAPDNMSSSQYVFGQLFCGGILISAVFFTCDPVTSPHTGTGRLVFGAVCGGLAVLVRVLFSFEGTYIVVLCASLWVPLMDRFLRPGVFGGLKTPKAEESTPPMNEANEGET